MKTYEGWGYVRGGGVEVLSRGSTHLHGSISMRDGVMCGGGGVELLSRGSTHLHGSISMNLPQIRRSYYLLSEVVMGRVSSFH